MILWTHPRLYVSPYDQILSPHPFPITFIPLHRFVRNTGVFTKSKDPIQRLRNAIAIGKQFWFFHRAQSQDYIIGLGERLLDNPTCIYQIFVLANNKCPWKDEALASQLPHY